VDVKRDESGGPVRSRLDEALLRGLARRTRGAYFSASRPGGELARLLAALGSVSRGDRGERLVERAVPRFPWLAAAAALLLASELGRARRRRDESNAGRPVRRGGAAPAPAPAAGDVRRRAVTATAIVMACGVAGSPAMAQSDWALGDRAFRQQRYAAAESLYARRAGRSGPAAVRVNRATAQALAGRGARAESLLATLKDGAGAAGATASYNLGTLEARDGRLDDALGSLRQALEREPQDADARYNYELALRRKRERERPASPPPAPGPAAPQPQGAGRDPTAGAQPPTPPPGTPPSPQPPSPADPSPGPGGMDRRTAEQLLGSLAELERIEQQRLRKVRVVRERRGKDW
jgi:Ca-activated chloride channel family protein